MKILKINKLFFTILVLFFIVVLQSCGPEIEGCTDPSSINFNPEANRLKDSCCVNIYTKKITINKPKVSISIDNNRFSEINYKFIYNSNINDTIKSYPFVKSSYRIRHLALTNYIPDTLEISLNSKTNDKLSKHEVFTGNRIKVIETIGGKSRTYFISLKEKKGMHLFNPRGLNKYKTEQVTYSTLASFNSVPNKVKRYKGFYNNVEDNISFWFKDHPYSITVYEREYSLKKFYRTNIIRY
tara:strand:+ start:180 stop:902 length:723 start_codon:yes stop_codon:yes gene_type:complete